MGTSRGGEASLILGSVYPKLVHGVIALVPSSVVNSTSANPDWTIGGQDLPFTEIPVERINGPVLAVGGGQDQVWPSSIHVDNIARRLREHGRDVTALVYRAAGHGIGLPFLTSASPRRAGRTRVLRLRRHARGRREGTGGTVAETARVPQPSLGFAFAVSAENPA